MISLGVWWWTSQKSHKSKNVLPLQIDVELTPVEESVGQDRKSRRADSVVPCGTATLPTESVLDGRNQTERELQRQCPHRSALKRIQKHSF